MLPVDLATLKVSEALPVEIMTIRMTYYEAEFQHCLPINLPEGQLQKFRTLGLDLGCRADKAMLRSPWENVPEMGRPFYLRAVLV